MRKHVLNKYVATPILIVGFSAGFSGKALARDHYGDHYERHGRDSTPPVITATVNGTQGSNAWYKSNVSITWNVSDPESSITNTSGSQFVPDLGYFRDTYTCQATSRGGTSSKSVTIKRDATAPKATIVSPANGATYTQGQTVKASYSCADSTSGVNSCTGTVANSANLDFSAAGTKSFSVNSSDQAGNTTTASISYTVVSSPQDSTPPVIQATVKGTQGNNGWYTGNVNLTWSVSDPDSAITSTSGCNNVSVTTDTSGKTYTCQAGSKGGNSSKSITIKRDATPPKATIVSPDSGATYTQGQTVKASYTCSDSTSGVRSCTGTVANGANLDLSATGSKLFSVKATDQAGNSNTSSLSYTVSADNGGSAAATRGLSQWHPPVRLERPRNALCGFRLLHLHIAAAFQ